MIHDDTLLLIEETLQKLEELNLRSSSNLDAALSRFNSMKKIGTLANQHQDCLINLVQLLIPKNNGRVGSADDIEAAARLLSRSHTLLKEELNYLLTTLVVDAPTGE